MSNAILPSLHGRWAVEFLGGQIPGETKADCQQCPLLVAPPTHDHDINGHDIIWKFHPRTKCCSYYPKLSNYQVGNILNETDYDAAPARSIVASRVQAQFAATPTSLNVPPAYALLYSKSPYNGTAFSLRCPYYMEDLMGGACGIYQYRETVCSTWFCKYDRGQVGASFWRESLRPFFKELEHTLSYWCLTQLTLPEENLKRVLAADAVDHSQNLFTAEMLDGQVDPEEHYALWGPWSGREAEFYSECGRLVSALSAQEVLAIGGPAAELRLRLVRKAYRELLSSDMPHGVLRTGHYKTQLIGDGTAQLVSYDPNTYDPLILPIEALKLLSYFEGRTLDDALNAISEDAHIEMDLTLVRKLLDFKILEQIDAT